MVDVHILVTINVYQEQKDSNCCINHIIKRRVDRYALNTQIQTWEGVGQDWDQYYIYAPQVKWNNILKRLEKDKFSFTIDLLWMITFMWIHIELFLCATFE